MKTLEELAEKYNQLVQMSDFLEQIPNTKQVRDYLSQDRKLAFLAGYEAGAKSAEPRWVGVEERLPEPHQRVLIYDKSDAEPMIVDWRFNSTMGTQHWDGAGDVTHWQPLPKAPSPPSDGGE